MICNSQKCDDQSPHDWGDDGCDQPTYLCGNCGAYFDEPNEGISQRQTHEQEEVSGSGCPECGAEEYSAMHDGFERGNSVIVLDGAMVKCGTYYALYSNLFFVVLTDEGSKRYAISHVFSATKSGWLKLSEWLESQMLGLRDSLDLADIEIKKIEEEEEK